VAVNFSACGTRWRVLPIDSEAATKQHVPRLPGPGLLFTSADAEMRFLALAPDAVPSDDFLAKKSIAELAAMVDLARPLAR
jgi:hypothetical protein